MVKNVVFDVGNVLLWWKPQKAVEQVFPQDDAAPLTQQMFKSDPWKDLNRGLMTMDDLVDLYHRTLGIEKPKLELLMERVKDSLTPIPGSLELLEHLSNKGVPLYCITDNVHEIMDRLREKYDFWKYFKGVVVSADLGILKPAPEIYHHLLDTYNLKAEECVFIDDYGINVEGAKAVGMKAIAFTDAQSCRAEVLKMLGME
jgi:putative hydrolase of the HAD superfamily